LHKTAVFPKISMHIFIDSANLEDIENALKRGFARGVTTNPSLLAKEPKAAFEAHVGKIIDLITMYQPGISFSVEVFSSDPDTILAQAKHFVDTFKYPNLAIKVQVGWNELEIIRRLSSEGIRVNCTCAMSISQAMMAAAAGAQFVSLFWGRIRDGGGSKHELIRQQFMADGRLQEQDFDPSFVVQQTRMLLDQSYPDVQIIVGSIRKVVDIVDAGRAGAHIVTVPPAFFQPMMEHFKTTEVVDQFLQDFSAWLA